MLFLAFAARAAGAPFVIGTGEHPDVSVDATGVAYIAWTGAETGNPAHFCRLPRGAAACDIASVLPPPPGVTGSTTRPVVQVTGSRVSVLHYTYGSSNQITLYQSADGGASFASRTVGGNVPIYGSAAGPGDTISVVTSADGRGTVFQNVPLAGGAAATFATLDVSRPYYGAVGLDGQLPVVIAESGASIGAFRRLVSGDPNAEANWSAPADIGYLDYPRLAGGPLGLFALAGDEAGGMFVRRFDGTTFGARVAVSPGDASESALVQDAGGRMHAVFPRLDASGYHGVHAVSDDGVTWSLSELDAQPFDEQGAMRVSAAADHIGVAVWRAAGQQIKVAAFAAQAPAVVQPPPPPPVAADPVPEFGKTVVLRPVSGTVRVRIPPSSRFVPLTTLDDVPLGATIDAKGGRVELRSVPSRSGAVETVQLYDGMFKVTQSRGITDFALNEPLAPCSKRGHAAASKPKKRKLWGNGKGKFRTSGKYAAATVRGTRWLVTDQCSGTTVRVAQGSVSVRDKVKRRSVVVRAGKSYTARR